MLEIKDARKTYRMGKVDVKALDGVSLKITSGEFVAIMGPSGSGKSTLMHILGLLDRPDSGSYLLGGKEISKVPDNDLAALRNRVVGFVFQQFHLLPRMTALENAELPLIYAGKRHLKQKARQELEGVGLAERMDHRPNEMSGGQQQRVAIARSLVNDPFIILADEPTGNLDSKSQEEIMGILKSLNIKGKTVIIVTHEKDIAAGARRVIQMRDGKIVSDETSDIVGKSPELTSLEDEIIDDILSRPAAKARETKFVDYLKQAVSTMLAHKMRSLLSILGILIGVAAVIAMLALGQGAQESIQKQLASLGSNLLMVRPGSARVGGIAMEAGLVTRFTFNDVTEIEKLPGVSRIYPSVSGRGQLVYGNKNWNTQVEGTGTAYEQMRASVPIIGRFFNEHEVKMRQKTAVIGLTVARELFGDENPVGKTIKINLLNFKVIGVLPEKGGGWRDQDDVAVIPITTAMYRVFGKQYIDQIFVEAKSPELLDAVESDVSRTIIKTHRLARNGEDSFQIRNMADIKNTLEATTKTMSLLLGSIAAISLVVGGIGIMNIMLVSVTERTREIGLRKAIGAANRDIMLQFLVEAVLMSFLGGISGIALGMGTAGLITVFAGWSARVLPSSVVLAATFSIIVGIVFGIWPAKKASRLDPIEALRYE